MANPSGTAATTNNYSTGPRVAISIGASPFVFQNPEPVSIEVIVSGGTVTTIEFSRDGSTFDVVGLLAGQFRLSPNDRLRVTYAVIPGTMSYYPL